jgi:sugar lactone lactonase YvrE
VYVADTDSLVLKLDQQGILTVVAGNGSAGFSGDGGSARSASLNSPSGLAVDSAGNLFIADSNNNRIRKVTPGGVITTVAGNGAQSFTGDGGPATSASLDGPAGVALDSVGNLFISDSGNNRIRKVTTAGVIATVAGSSAQGFSGDGGPATSASLFSSLGIAVDNAGNLFIADYNNDRIRMVTPAGVISTIAGSGFPGYSGDGGPATRAAIFEPAGVAIDSAGNLVIADNANSRVRRVAPGGIISTVAGNGVSHFAGDGSAAVRSLLSSPFSLAPDSAGNLFIADTGNNRIRKITRDGIISTVAGSGNTAISGETGLATASSLDFPIGMAVDTAGNLLIADSIHYRIRKVSPGGAISTFAGTGLKGFSGDGGQATAAALSLPTGMVFDAAGDLLCADYGNNRIRMITPSGVITTVAGNGVSAFSGDGGPATGASLGFPTGVAIDTLGNLFIADTGNNRIRKVTPGGVISTVAGNGAASFSGDGGLATGASLNQPGFVAVDTAGNLFIADSNNNRIRKVTTAGFITTVVGGSVAGFSGDGGPAASSSLFSPQGVAIDAAGNLIIADEANNRVRVVLAASPSFQTSPVTLNISGTAGGAPVPALPVNLAPSVAGLAYTASADSPWIVIVPPQRHAPRVAPGDRGPFPTGGRNQDRRCDDNGSERSPHQADDCGELQRGCAAARQSVSQ